MACVPNRGCILASCIFNVLLRRIIGLQWPEESCFGHRESRKCSSRAYFVNDVNAQHIKDMCVLLIDFSTLL